MEFWIVDPRDNKPQKVTIDPERKAVGGSHLRWIPDLKIWIAKDYLFSTLEDAALAHLKVLKKKRDIVDREIKHIAKQQEVSPEDVAQMEIRAVNNNNFRRTKVPHLWIVK